MITKLHRVKKVPKSYEFRTFNDPFNPKQASEIFNILALLKTSYIDKQKWNPNSNAPAEFIVAEHPEHPGEKILLDKYVLRGTWFAVYQKQNNQLIACARAILPLDDGQLQLHDYPSAKAIIEKYLPKNQIILELDRCAVHADFQGIGIVMFLLHQVITYYQNHNYTFVTATANAAMLALYKMLAFSSAENMTFFYDATDPQERTASKLFIISPDLQINAMHKLEQLLKNKKNAFILENQLKPAAFSKLFKLPNNNNANTKNPVATDEENEFFEAFKLC